MNSPTESDKPCSSAMRDRCELDENLEILRNVPAFSAIPLQNLRLYAYLSRRRCYRAGEFLFHQGDMDDCGYIVVSGTARVLRELKDCSIFLNELKEGEFFGGLALFSDIRRLFSVRAVTDVECLTLDRESFRRMLLQFPDVSLKVLDIMIKRIVQMEEKLFQACPDVCML
ncbi:MAG: cyclic nucleotide-binding domain-containing protein [Syntrophobacteraceae bacterium]|nr:cyclic nucleotide-binding domain-containing protein [Syntrophobacteraceae bacterium]